MRTLLTIFACTAFLTLRGQIVPPPPQPQQPHLIIQPFSGINIGYMFVGNGITYVSAPVGIAIYRPLNNNFTAFTAATLAPTAFHFTSLYNTPFHNPAYGSGGYTGFGANAAVSGGLIYTNDAHTFSISGSISVQRGSYPVYVAPARTTARKQY
ncbi:MAG TPA: hypothetical protein VMH27_00100 [Puia sp.]|nr:hypothetical protein [Puia sp.]